MPKYTDHQPSTTLSKILKSDDAVANLIDEVLGALKVSIAGGNVTLNAGDLQIGAVEIKDHDGANRLDIVSAGEAIAAPTSLVLSGHDGANARLIKTDAAGELQIDVLTLPNVTIGAALPAGANNIGDVDIASALPAGNNNIGDVDIASALPAGTNRIGKVTIRKADDLADIDPLAEATFTGRIGEVQATPTANTVLARLKDLLTGIILAVGNNVIGKVKIRNSADTADIDPASEATLASIKDTAGIKKITDPLPAGTNNIGDVDVLTLPAIPAGTNNIGDVDVLTLPALPAGSNTIGKTIDAGLDAVREKVENLSLAAGSNNLDFTAVPTAKQDVVTNVAWRYVGTVASVRFEVQVFDGTNAFTVHKTKADPVSGDFESLQAAIVLKAADKIRVVVSGATLNDDATVYIIGQRRDA